MTEVIISQDEADRIEALKNFDIVDSPHDESFDEIARLAAELFEAPYTMISLVGKDRQSTISHIGLSESETRQEISFCQHTILQEDVLVVPNALDDSRFADNPLVTGGAGVRFYAGVPLVNGDGFVVGALGIMDTVPRVLTASQAELLVTLGQRVTSQIELHHSKMPLIKIESESDYVGMEQKETQGEITEHVDFLSAIMGSISEGIYTIDNDGLVTFINQAAETMLGWTKEELIGKRIHDFIHYQHRDGKPMVWADCNLHRIPKSGICVKQQEDWFVKRDGSSFAVLCSSSPIKINGSIVGLVLAFSDDTDRRSVEQEKREHDAQIRALADNIGALLGRVDRNERYTFCNHFYEERFGIPSEQILGKTLVEVVGQEYYEFVRDNILKAFAGEVVHFEAEVPVVGKGKRFHHTTYTPEFDLEGEVTGLIIFSVDVTERRQMETKLAQAQKLESIGQLAAGIAHEINSPIQYIGHNAQFLSDGFAEIQELLEAYKELASAVKSAKPVEAAVRKVEAVSEKIDLPYLLKEIPAAIAQSLEGTERVTTIVGAMKEFSHPGKGDKSYVDLNHVLESTSIVCRHDWKYVANLITEFDSTLPQVYCLPGELSQVFLNIITNAAHAIEDVVRDGSQCKGTITLTTRKVKVDGEDWAEVRIRDSGTGIKPESISRVFDPFYTTKPVGKGTGQGLAISHDIVVNKHGGTIDCMSELGYGTTFIIRLPLTRTDSNI